MRAPGVVYLNVVRAAGAGLGVITSAGDCCNMPPGRLARAEAVAPSEYFFRTLVRFTTGAPAWLHLNKVMAIAVGQREARAVLLDLYRLC